MMIAWYMIPQKFPPEYTLVLCAFKMQDTEGNKSWCFRVGWWYYDLQDPEHKPGMHHDRVWRVIGGEFQTDRGDYGPVYWSLIPDPADVDEG